MLRDKSQLKGCIGKIIPRKVAIMFCFFSGYHSILACSPVTQHNIFGRKFFFKRDDLLLTENGLSGNKARKFWKLANKPKDEFPRHIVSYGGIQSNAMLSIAQLVYEKEDCNFTYFSKAIPKFVKNFPSGNFELAVRLGMKVIELSTKSYDKLVLGDYDSILIENSISPNEVHFIPQGGADPDAALGFELLSQEILNYIKSFGGNWKILVASGTGTSALYLSKGINSLLHSESSNLKNVDVVAIPCVGSSSYLKAQMAALNESQIGFPEIMQTIPGDTTRAFAKPYIEHFEIWNFLLQETNVEFDMLYAPRAWELIRNNLNDCHLNWDEDINIMYYHCGGVHPSTASQLARYRYEGIYKP